jgi:SAM-dependent methyltransferase
VARICDGIDLSEAAVLDLGCGLGGATVALAGDLAAAHVTALDVEPGNLEQTRAAVAEAGLAHKVDVVLAEPGPVPLPDASIDLVFCKAVICHMKDKAAFFAQVRPAVKAGGLFVGADWMRGCEHPESRAWEMFEADLKASGLDFYFDTTDTHTRAFEQAGFADVAFEDISGPTRIDALEALAKIEGPSRRDLVEAMGEAGYEGFRDRCRARAEALGNGDLEYRIFKAVATPR